MAAFKYSGKLSLAEINVLDKGYIESVRNQTRQSVESVKRLLIYVEHRDAEKFNRLLAARKGYSGSGPQTHHAIRGHGALENPEWQKVDKEMSPKILNKWKRMTTAMQFVQVEKLTGLCRKCQRDPSNIALMCRKCQRDPSNIALMVKALIPV